MTRVDQLVAWLIELQGEALIASSHRPVHAIVEGNLRQTSDVEASTEDILQLLAEIAPPGVRARLEGDCELIFPYTSPGLADLDVIVERKAEFVFARLQIARRGSAAAVEPSSPAPAPRQAPPAPTTAPAASAPAASMDSGLTARDLEFEGGDAILELDEGSHPLGGAPGVGGEAFFPGAELDLDAPSEATSGLFLDLTSDIGTDADGGETGGDGAAQLDPQYFASLLEQSSAAVSGSAAANPSPSPGRPASRLDDQMVARASQTALEVSQAALQASQAALQASQAFSSLHPLQPAVGLQAARALSLDVSGVRTLGALLALLVRSGASDLHLAPGSPPRMRLHGELRPLDQAPLSAEETRGMFETALSPDQLERFEAEKSLDFSLEVTGLGRFRANAYLQRNGFDLVFRAIPPRIPTLAELGLPESVSRLTEFPNGLILVTGPAGSGKSTTQAAIIDRINETWNDHIITVEDPIEYVHPVKNCLVNQREVGTHVLSFSGALRSALREDPDVILVGELRDLETIHLAITAAETGHLVIATLHTVNAARTIDRLIDVFPGAQKLQVRSMVSESLRGVVSQKLVPTADGTGRVAAFEVLIGDRSISNLIREGKTFQIPNALRVGKARGMCLMDEALLDLVRQKRITPQVALEHMERPEDLQKLMGAPGQPARRGPANRGQAGN